MNWPWVKRGMLAAAQKQARWAETALKQAEERVHGLMAQLATAEARTAELEAERRKLLDRIVNMAGQPALYEKPAEPSTPPPVASAGAQEFSLGPRTVRIDEIHAAVNDARRNKTLKLPLQRA